MRKTYPDHFVQAVFSLWDRVKKKNVHKKGPPGFPMMSRILMDIFKLTGGKNGSIEVQGVRFIAMTMTDCMQAYSLCYSLSE